MSEITREEMERSLREQREREAYEQGYNDAAAKRPNRYLRRRSMLSPALTWWQKFKLHRQ